MCAFSGGADSTALVALAAAAGHRVLARHVDHGIRPESSVEADSAVAIGRRLGVEVEVVEAVVDDGPNLEARARAARRACFGPRACFGHTLDDQAETALLAMLRGAGAAGLAAIRPGPAHPLLALRRTETHELCRRLGVEPVCDPSNRERRFRRNRVRSEVLPLLDAVAERDVSPLLSRLADHARADDDLLSSLADDLDPTDAHALRGAPRPLARRAVRRWLTRDGYPPGAAAVERVLDVARGDAVACEVTGIGRVARSSGRLWIEGRFDPDASTR